MKLMKLRKEALVNKALEANTSFTAEELNDMSKTEICAIIEANTAETVETETVETETVEEHTPEETEVERIDPRVQTQEFIDVQLAKRADYIMCKYTPRMKRTTVLNRDNMRGMFYCEVQKKSVTFHSKKDMLPESLEAVAKVVIGNKPNPYAVKCGLDELERVLALYLARVERVRLERKTVAR